MAAEVAQASSYPWPARIVDGLQQPAEPDSLSITIRDPNDDVVMVADLSSGVIHDSFAVYRYDWAVASDAILGLYTARWEGDLNGGPILGLDSVQVVQAGSIIPSPDAAPASTYMTPARFATSGLGVNLKPFSAIEIVNHLEDASAEVDSYCNVPLLPYPHSFLGGRARDEEHKWQFPQTATQRGQRRVYPKHWPIINVESMRLVVGFDAGADLPLNTLVVNQVERWVEVTALTISNSSGLFGVSGWIVPMGGLTVPIAKITYTYGWRLPKDRERMDAVDDAGKVLQARHGFWTDDDIVCTVDGVAETDFEIDREEGRLTFSSAPTGKVLLSYVHRLPREIERATSLVAAYLIGEAGLRKRGMQGLSRLRVNEIDATRQQRLRGDNPMDLALTVPAAALLLAGHRYWSQG